MKIMKFIKKTSNYISHLKESVQKWTGGDGKWESKQRRKGKEWEKKLGE